MAMNHLAKQFFDHSIARTYLALVWGTFDEKEGTISANIGRHKRFRMMMDVYPDAEEGKEAITHFVVKENLGYVSLVECMLETGRTHQIRVHMKYAGHPVFNDEVYGGNTIVKGTVYSSYRQFIDNCFKLCPRQALHAHTLGFIHPQTKKTMAFTAALPTDMELLLSKWRRYVTTSLKY
jgi:23S rRNA pseudouridine1911/1915/1917 synthase